MLQTYQYFLTKMSIENRQHLRFSLDLPAFRNPQKGEPTEVWIKQLSIGGCLIEWVDFFSAEDDFRLEFILPNNNHLPLHCKVIYRAVGSSVGVKFYGITKFEQELLSNIISDTLKKEGFPLTLDPFSEPPPIIKEEPTKKVSKKKINQDENLEEATF